VCAPELDSPAFPYNQRLAPLVASRNDREASAIMGEVGLRPELSRVLIRHGVQMLDAGVRPDADTYNLMLKLLVRGAENARLVLTTAECSCDRAMSRRPKTCWPTCGAAALRSTT
jgi:hypothetical protein